MSRITKLVLIFSLITVFTAVFSFGAGAIDEETSVIDGDSSSYVDEGIDDTDDDSSLYEDDDSDYDDSYDSSSEYYSDSAVSDDDTGESYNDSSVTSDEYYEEPDYNNDTDEEDYDYNYEDNSDYSGEDYDTYDFSDDNYVGGNQTYVVPDSTAPSAALYDVDENIDDSVLDSGDWGDIAENLKNAGDQSDDDSDDFSFIKDNESVTDNGDWMLYVGIGCLTLGIAGIVYVVVSNIRRRKKLGAGKVKAGTQSKKAAYAGAGSSGKYTSSSDIYGDGYKSESRSRIKKSRKFDTADVVVPKTGSHYKNTDKTGGRRYK